MKWVQKYSVLVKFFLSCGTFLCFVHAYIIFLSGSVFLLIHASNKVEKHFGTALLVLLQPLLLLETLFSAKPSIVLAMYDFPGDI